MSPPLQTTPGVDSQFSPPRDRRGVEAPDAAERTDRLDLVAEALAAYPYEWDVRTGRVERAADFPTLLGLAPEEIAGDVDWWRRRMHPEDLSGPIEATRQALADPAVRRVSVEYRVRHRDGSWRWMRDRSICVRDDAGHVVRVVGITADVTEEREQQAALARAMASATTSAAEVRSLLDRMADAYVAVDRDWRITHVNTATARINGTTPEALLGRDAWEVWAAALGTPFEAELRAAMADGRPRTFVAHYRGTAADGGDDGADADPPNGGIWLEDRVYPSAEGLSVFFRDVSEEYRAREAEQAARGRAERLLALTAALAASRTVDEVAEVVVEQAHEAAGATSTLLAVCAPDTLEARLAGVRGLPTELLPADRRLAREPAGPAVRCLSTGAPIWVSGRGTDTPRTRFPEAVAAWDALGVRAVASLPLTVAGADGAPVTVGVVSFTWATPRAFPEHEQAFFLSVAAQAAQAIERARLSAAEGEARRRAERLQALTAALARALTAAEVAEVAVVEAGRAVDAITGTIVLLDEDGSCFTLLPGPGMPADIATEWRRFPNAGTSPAATAVRTLQPHYSPTRADFLAANPAFASLLDRLPVEANVALPLVVGAGTPAQRVFGALTFSFGTPRTFGPEEDAFLRAAADQCAQALERARLFEAEREARRWAERLHALTAAFAGTLTPSDVAAVAHHAVREALGAAVGSLATLTEDGRELELIPHVAWTAPAAIAHPLGGWQRCAATPGLPVVDAMASGEVLTLGSLADWETRYPALAPSVATDGFGAAAVVPLALSGRAVGALTCNFVGERTFTAEERSFLAAVGRQTAQALERARLYAAEQEARARADAANAAKSQFLATMSHELRTPLNAIQGHVQLMELELHGPLTDRQREALARVGRAQHHLLGLINDVLNYAKLEAGTVAFDVRPTLVADVIARVLPLIEPQLVAKGLALTVSLPEDPDRGEGAVPVWADGEKLGQVLLNLLTNAVKFTPHVQADGTPGRIEIELTTRADAAEVAFLRVRDTGIGIPADQQARIFDPFVQVSTGLTRSVEGTGLGLAISRDLARGMGGDLRVRSQEGAGATFTVTLRRVTAAGGLPADHRARSEPPGPERRGSDARRPTAAEPVPTVSTRSDG